MIAQESAVCFGRLERTDGARLERFFHRLSPESRYRRFLSPVARPEQAHPELLLDVDHHDREAVVALAGAEIAGVARYARRSGSSSAEVAVVVADEWQRRGLALRLLQTLAGAARREGVDRFEVLLQGDNLPAVRLLQRFSPGVLFTLQAGFFEAAFELPLR